MLTDAGRRGTFVNEAELAAEIGVSRTPVREAFLLLAADGLVEMVPQRGAFIPWLTRRAVADLFEVRQMVECHAASTTIARDAVPVIGWAPC